MILMLPSHAKSAYNYFISETGVVIIVDEQFMSSVVKQTSCKTLHYKSEDN